VVNNVKNGCHKDYHENGQLRCETKFRDGSQQDGWVVSYHDNGNKAREVYVEKVLFQGEFQEWQPDGKLKLKGIYKDDKVVEILYKSEE
jgi:antitoxin component YwqK of YwqJK toxin-antitoxin module